MTLLMNLNHKWISTLLEESSFVVNRLGRVKNVLLSDGTHIVSPRLTDGGLSLTTMALLQFTTIEIFQFQRVLNSLQVRHYPI